MGTKTVGSMASASSTASKPVVAPETKTLAFPAKSEHCDEIKVETEPEVEDVGDRRECAAPGGEDAGGQHLHQGRSDSFGRPERPPSRSDTQRPLSSAEQRIAAAIRQHYYPEGGWGWVVCVCVCLVNALSWGMQLNYGVMHAAAVRQFGEENADEAPWLGSASLASSLFVSPVVVAWCRRKSVRLTAVLGGLVAALGCLFSSFASQLHQGLFSQGLVLGLGLGMARDAGGVVLGQYFKRRRHCAEVVACAGSGLGTAAMAAFFHSVLGSLGWRHGLQAATGLVSLNFVLGAFYRSASLYHPQRRAILHLKNQRRKIKEKRPRTEKPPFFDFAALRTRTLRVVMVTAALAAAGLYTPFFCLVPLSAAEGVQGAWALQALLGLASAGGAGVAGLLLVRHPTQCVLSRRCLCQLSLLGAGLAMLALGALNGFAGYALFAAVYGASAGAVAYALRMLVFERLRARHFGRAWGFVQWAQCLPVLVGVPVTGYISKSREDPKAGFYFSAACTFAGATSLFFLPDAARVESQLCHHHATQQRQRQNSSYSHDTSCCGDRPQSFTPAAHYCRARHHRPGGGYESPNKGSFEGGSPTVEVPDGVVVNNTPCTCRGSLLCYQRTMSWATSVDFLDQPALAALPLDAECLDDEVADMVVGPPQFSERAVDNRVSAETGASGAVDAEQLCECARSRDRTVIVSPKMHVARCSHEPLIFRSTMTPIEEVTSAV
nr:monocarboxylate transporter 8-like [Rhipicephalus microplus]